MARFMAGLASTGSQLKFDDDTLLQVSGYLSRLTFSCSSVLLPSYVHLQLPFTKAAKDNIRKCVFIGLMEQYELSMTVLRNTFPSGLEGKKLLVAKPVAT